MRRRCRAMTLIETMTCLAIIAILVAVTMPVLASAKKSALERQSVSDMRQIAMAALIYRQDWKEAEYGSMEAMGLPESYFKMFGGIGKSASRPPIRRLETDTYYWMPLREKIDERETTWIQAAALHQDRTVLICDPWFMGFANGTALAWIATRPNRINGIDLGGTLIRKRPYGDFYDFTRWEY